MKTDVEAIVDHSELQKQIKYAKKMAQEGFDFGLVAASAFVESMRNTHYRHTGTAIDELIDNAIEAGATAVHVALGYQGKSQAQPDAIAIIDNGHGMVEQMLPLAVAWGGTHREGSRAGLGRFGFGLPSASVNQTRRYTVYSKVSDGAWWAVTIDLDDIAKGKYNNASGKVVVPKAKKAEPPAWVQKYVKDQFSGGELNHGTVVVWEHPDRLDWTTTAGLTRNLLQHFGITFRFYLKDVDIFFDGTRVEPTDPLFVMPGFRFYDLDEDRAEARPPQIIEVAAKASGTKVPIRIRYAAFPPSFFSIDKDTAAAKGNQNERFQVAKDNAGIVICRMGRQIDVLERTPWPGFERFRNDDRYWGMEIDFPAGLDEEFTISNAKQGVVIKDRIWNILKENGVLAAISSLRKEYEDARKVKASQELSDDGKRLSEKAMEESAKFRPQRARSEHPEREKQARDALEQYVKQRARQTQRPIDEVQEEVQHESEQRPYRVEFETLPGAPFFRVKQIGGMMVLYVNRDHRFYADIYASVESTPLVKAALETLLFSIGECELDAVGNPDRTHFYIVERQEWSVRLANALASLDKYVDWPEVSEGGTQPAPAFA